MPQFKTLIPTIQTQTMQSLPQKRGVFLHTNIKCCKLKERCKRLRMIQFKLILQSNSVS
ncbi:hypothetical protein DPMN_171927 [Dreissena polymorpha]|uniref:Uncharacterized protein n=1 Tax=Dreissena polymorpha TaxID=45954 RepID=A0A9D4E1B9_DREPO|nr:hypothetical protein DPMN_171927 [Dreissena polymorpha]